MMKQIQMKTQVIYLKIKLMIYFIRMAWKFMARSVSYSFFKQKDMLKIITWFLFLESSSDNER